MAPTLSLSPANALVQGGGKRPRAFGRTSNVWQYVEVVQERTTPASKYRPSSLGQVEDEDEELWHDSDDDPASPQPLSGDALHPIAPSSPSDTRKGSRKNSGGAAARVSSVADPHHRGSQLQRNSRGSTDVALPPVATNGKKASAASVVVFPTTTTTTAHNRKPVPFNANEIVRRIQSLGTSASAPQLPAPTAGAPTPGGSAVATAAPPPTATTAPPAAVVVAAAAPVPPTNTVPLSEAERLRNDFNSQRGKLYFGSSVAFELFNGHVLTVRSPDGAVGVHSLETLPLKSRAVFTLINLTDVRSASAIRYGDAVWLQLSVGTGETSWEQGGVLGAKVREAPQLKALALADDESIRNDTPPPLVVGHPVPVRAYLPKNRDDVDAQVDEIQSRVRNKSSKMLGKWIVRSALPSRGGRRQDAFVYNTDEIYLEQDWFYLGADSDAGVAVLRQLPAALHDKTQAGEYVVERRGAWRVRLLDSSNGSAGLSLAQQQMEKLLLRAKTQLKQSRKMRAGQHGTRVNGKESTSQLRGGATFVADLRAELAATTRDCDAQYIAAQERRLSQLPQHLSSVADTLRSARDVGEEEEEKEEKPDDPEVGNSRPPSTLSMPSSRAGSAGGRAKTTNETTSSSSESVCALCKSPSVGYNLCCQIHAVMSTLHAEQEEASAVLASAKVSAQSQRVLYGSASAPVLVARTGSAKSCGGEGSSPSATRAAATPSIGADKHGTQARRVSLTVPPGQTLLTSGPLTGSGGPGRLLALFTQQDQQILDIIKFKEKAAEAQRAAEAQARIGLSPVATHFRDRFKHVDQLVQQHSDELGHHGIGGHFQRLHAELKREETQRRESQLRAQRGQRTKKYLQTLAREHAATQPPDEDAEGEDSFVDVRALIDTTTMCPLEHPGEGFDAFGKPLKTLHVAGVARLFPTPDELDRLPPVDTKQALALYLQNKAAVVEMLDGFVDLVATHIVPNIANAVTSRNRGALVEFLDFSARAAEFVCARRVQVRAAQLLHAVSASAVGDFDAFHEELHALLEELDGTVAFVKYYREKVAKPKKKGAARK